MIPGVMTAFKENYELDEERFREHLKWLLQWPDIRGWGITAGVGEFYALTFEEFKRCQEIAVEVGHGKVHVWTNFGAEGFEKALKMAEAARTAGADGLRIIHPYFGMYPPETLYDYYRDLARALPDMSIMLYPQITFTGRPFPIDVMIKLADIENIVGVKLPGDIAFSEVCRLDAFTKEKQHKFALVSGSLVYFYHFARAGIQTKATIGPEPQIAPELCESYWKACTTGNWDEAIRGLRVLIEASPIKQWYLTNFPAPMKYAMKLLGRPLGPARRPCRPPTPEEAEAIENALIKANLLKAIPQ